MSLPDPLLALAAGRAPDTEPADWAALGVAARRHGMSGLVAGWANRAGVDIPADIRDAALLDRHLHARAAASLPGVVAAFAAASVPVLAWKGVTLATRHYAAPTERPCGDVDLLARTADAHAIATLLDVLAPNEAAQVRSPRLTPAQEPNPAAFHVSHGGPAVDVQFSLLRLGLVPRDEARVWDRAVAVRIGEVCVPAPGDAHLLVALLVHLARSRFSRLIWYADIARVGTNRELDVDEAARFARTEGVAHLAGAAAEVVARTLDVRVPVLGRVPGWYRAGFRATFPRASRLDADVREGPVRFVPRLAPALVAALVLSGRPLDKARVLAGRARNVRRRER